MCIRDSNIEQQNRNRLLLTDSSVDGVKTGHTESAGYCLVSSAKRNEDVYKRQHGVFLR